MPDNYAQLHSSGYLLPVLDTEFLLRDDLRAEHFAPEHRKAKVLLREHSIRSTVIAFGNGLIGPAEVLLMPIVTVPATPADPARA